VAYASLFGQSPPQKHPFTFEDMMKLKRVGAPVPSPDGKWVLFDAEDVDLEANTRISHLWIVPATGGESRRLNPTSSPRRTATVFTRRQTADLDFESE
jgi:dipeptidyl aminopeptidase/acylaminoacyl peptidase